MANDTLSKPKFAKVFAFSSLLMGLGAPLFEPMVASADSFNKATILHTNRALIVPGAQTTGNSRILSAPGHDGYLFKLLNTSGTRTIVSIYTGDGMKLLATVMGIPATRSEATGHAKFVFKKTRSGESVLRYWYFAGETNGIEFPWRH